MSLLAQLLANGLVTGSLYAVLAAGFGLVYRSTGVFHIAYGGAYVLAAFLFHSLVTLLGLPWAVAGATAAALSALAGWAMEAGFYGPFHRRGTAPGAVMVASLGLAIVIENSLALLYGNEIHAIPRDIAASLSFGPVRLTTLQLAQLGLCSTLLLGLAWARRLPFFRLVRAMGENPELLLVLGGRLSRLRAAVFALSGALVAVPACLTMADVGLDVHAGMSQLLIAAVAVLAGGVARVEGWLLGGFLLALLQSLIIWQFSTKWLDLVAFALLLVVLFFRREGLLGVRKRAEEP
jgi:branched-chain amino acid transport system permease protein